LEFHVAIKLEKYAARVRGREQLDFCLAPGARKKAKWQLIKKTVSTKHKTD
jgi:hypothetical protein